MHTLFFSLFLFIVIFISKILIKHYISTHTQYRIYANLYPVEYRPGIRQRDVPEVLPRCDAWDDRDLQGPEQRGVQPVRNVPPFLRPGEGTP